MNGRSVILPICLAAMAFALQAQPAGSASPTSFASEITRSLEIRREYDQPVPASTHAIYIDSVVVHHAHSEASTIVWLDADGRWQWSQVSKTGPGGLLDIAPRMDYATTRQLTEDESRTVQRLREEPSLYRGEARRTGEAGVGAPFHVMEIVTPKGRAVYQWDGTLRDEAGKIADLALGRGR
jgi:hypothetical protein